MSMLFDEKKGEEGSSELPEMAQRILSVAMELFARKGYSATSVREIVQAAKVTNPMLYYYFESKEGLFYRLLNLLFDEMDRRVLAVAELNKEEPFDVQLREIVKLHMEVVQESPVALRFIYAVLFGPKESHPKFNPEVRRKLSTGVVLEIFQDAMNRGEFVPREDTNLEFLVMQFFGMLNQYLLLLFMHDTHQIEPPLNPFGEGSCEAGRDMVEHLLSFYLGGAGRICRPDI